MSSLSVLIVVSLGICLIVNHICVAQAQPVEDEAGRLKRKSSDWFTSLFGDYFDDSESEEYLICRNCTVLVNGQGQNNGAINSTTAPETITAAATVPPTTSPTTAAITPSPSTITPASVSDNSGNSATNNEQGRRTATI